MSASHGIVQRLPSKAVYDWTAFGIWLRSTWSASMSGVRSWKAPLEHQPPTFAALNEEATSGAVPPRMAWLTLSSVWAATALTVMYGYFLWNLASTASTEAISCGELRPCQKVMVTGVVSSAPVSAFDVVPPVVHAAASSAVTASSDAATVRRAVRDSDMEPPATLLTTY